MQRGHWFAIVDEVDSILIDEARTPLIISGEPEAAAETYYAFARAVGKLEPENDYEVDEKMHPPRHRGGRVQGREGAAASTTCTPPRTASSSTT